MSTTNLLPRDIAKRPNVRSSVAFSVAPEHERRTDRCTSPQRARIMDAECRLQRSLVMRALSNYMPSTRYHILWNEKAAVPELRELPPDNALVLTTDSTVAVK